MNVLVTGVAGFVGRHLAERLIKEGHTVTGIERTRNVPVPPGVFLKEGDIRSSDIYPFFEGTEAVFHFAAKSDIIACQDDPVGTMDVNVRGTANVFEAARRAGARKVVLASSSVVEEGKARQNGFYAISKLASERIAEGYHAAWSVNYTTLRYFNIYGPGQDFAWAHPRIMARLMAKALRGERPMLYEGYEKNARDFVYIDDIIDFHMLCLTDGRTDNKLFRLGTGTATSIQEIWELTKKISGTALEAEVLPPVSGDIPLSGKADTHDAEALGWKPKTALEEGMRRQFEALKRELGNGTIRT